jgi:hypothetical protein
LRDLLDLLPLEDFDDADKTVGVWLGISELGVFEGKMQDGASLGIGDGSMEGLGLMEGSFTLN